MKAKSLYILAAIVPWLYQCGTHSSAHLKGEQDMTTHKPGYYTACPQPGMVALSFDDGVADSYVPLLDALKKEQVKATMFVLGQTLNGQPKNAELLKRAVAEGHQIGNHSYDHPYLTNLSDQQIEQQLVATDNEIYKILGTRPRIMRPPHGAVNDAVLAKLYGMGYDVIIWSIDPSDWEDGTTTDKVYNKFASVLSNADPKTQSFIALQHDWQASSVAALPKIIALIRQKGFRLVTVGECLGL